MSPDLKTLRPFLIGLALGVLLLLLFVGLGLAIGLRSGFHGLQYQTVYHR